MNWKKKCLEHFELYGITDLKEEDPEIISKIEAALRGGVDIVQLRSKVLFDRALLEVGRKVRRLTEKLQKLFMVNDRIDLMMAMGADGVHLGQGDLPIDVARQIIGDRTKIIGRSTHSLDQAIQAEQEGADYIGFGPIFATPTKPGYAPVGLRQIASVMEQVKIPVVCIGGIDRTNVKQVIEAGGRRVAVVRAIFSARDPYQAACELKGLLKP